MKEDTATCGKKAKAGSKTSDLFIMKETKDAKHGFGTERFIDGSIYEGQYTRNTRNGRGTLRLPIGEVYVGDFKDNLMHGKGKYTWTSETHYWRLACRCWSAGNRGKRVCGRLCAGAKAGLRSVDIGRKCIRREVPE